LWSSTGARRAAAEDARVAGQQAGVADERAVAAAAPEAVVVPLPVGVYHVTLVGGDDSSAAAAVVGVAAATPTNATCRYTALAHALPVRYAEQAL